MEDLLASAELTCKIAASFDDKKPRQATCLTLLRDDGTTALGCMFAVRGLFGDSCRAWEPESLWLSIENMGGSISRVNKDKVLGAHTITMNPAFWWDALLFHKTVMAFNNTPIHPDTIQEPTPEELAWGVYEAEAIYAQSRLPDTPEFDYAPAGFTAICLHRDGMVLAPTLLSFCQERLDALNEKTDGVTVSAVRTARHKDTAAEEDLEEATDAVRVQLAKLAAVDAYVNDRNRRLSEDLSRFRQ